MKYYSKLIVYVLLIISLFSACGKYEEGPSFCLTTKNNRLTGKYELIKMYINDTEMDLTEDMGIISITVEYKKDGTGEKNTITQHSDITEEFEWKFDDNKDYLLERIIIDSEHTTDWITNQQIIRLARDGFWLRIVQYPEITEMHYSKIK